MALNGVSDSLNLVSQAVKDNVENDPVRCSKATSFILVFRVLLCIAVLNCWELKKVTLWHEVT